MTLKIIPTDELVFSDTSTKVSTAILILENYGAERLAYKIQTQLKSFCIKPYKGFLDPCTTVHVQITFKPQQGTDRQIVSERNKLRIQCMNVPSMSHDDFEAFWEQYAVESEDVQTLFLNCRFVTSPIMIGNTTIEKVDIGVQTSDMESFFESRHHQKPLTPNPSRRSKVKSFFSHKRSSSVPSQSQPIIESPKDVSFYMIFGQSYAPFRRDEINIHVKTGDLITTTVDAIVIAQSSHVLLKNIVEVAGESVRNQYKSSLEKDPNASIITVTADGPVKAKKIYFLPFEPSFDPLRMRKSIEKLVKSAMTQAINDQYRSIAFPAIGCGYSGCSPNLIAHMMVQEVSLVLEKYSLLSVQFVILPEQVDIFDQFQRKLNLISQLEQSSGYKKSVSLTVGNGSIVIEKGNLDRPNVDIMVNMSLSKNLKNAILSDTHQPNITVYNNRGEQQPDSTLFSIVSDRLSRNPIYFANGRGVKSLVEQNKFYMNLISILIQRSIADDFPCIAMPIISCKQYGFSAVSSVSLARILFHGVRRRIFQNDIPLSVKFLVQENNDDVYEMLREQMLAILDTNHSFESESFDGEVTSHIDYNVGYNLDFPSTWQCGRADEISFILTTSSKEYKEVLNEFNLTMLGNYKQIIRICRIQNERCYLQYIIHSQELRKQLKIDTEIRLFHGCPEEACESIIENGFNRSFAGINGTHFGFGVYFSIYACYSHYYARPNASEERHMFLSRVLIGQTCPGDDSMKTPTEGCHSSTNDHAIFVTYHDAQAYPEYLIIYN